MKIGWASGSLRASRDPAARMLQPQPAAGEPGGEAQVPERLWFNVLVVGGGDADVMRLHRNLTHAQALPWRPAEEVEREVVFLALRRSGRRIEALSLEDILQACEEVENRHLITNAAVARHFRNLWNTSSAYCRHFMRGLLALKPGDVAGSARLTMPGGLFREGFSLTRVILPPYRVLQGSYRYAGRNWCLQNWGTPEDARLIGSRFEAIGGGRRLAIYEFETVENPPAAALQRLAERNAGLIVGCVSVDADSGQRRAYGQGRAARLQVEALPAVPMVHGGFSGNAYVETTAAARRLVLARLAPSDPVARRA
ncbi:hypothetical protein AAG565_13010 [Fontimonas sp. SYSU GA230001]|uniref:hypothetical protein n=1 Tax=Fontimonas sp. SYSU GA230001 TaxID=3142450 RepID=UPI0032B4E8E6